MIFRVKYHHSTGPKAFAPVAPHIRGNIYAAPGAGKTFVQIGTFIMRPEEFQAFAERFQAEFEETGTVVVPP